MRRESHREGEKCCSSGTITGIEQEVYRHGVFCIFATGPTKVEMKLESVVVPPLSLEWNTRHQPNHSCTALHVQVIVRRAMSCRNAVQMLQDHKSCRIGTIGGQQSIWLLCC